MPRTPFRFAYEYITVRVSFFHDCGDGFSGLLHTISPVGLGLGVEYPLLTLLMRSHIGIGRYIVSRKANLGKRVIY